jgi:hypothetical protein
MATITVVEGVGTYPSLASANGAATGAWVDLDTGASANSFNAKKGDVLIVWNDAASTGDTISATVEGTNNPYGVQADKVKEVNGMDFSIFEFEVLEGWVPDGGTLVYLTVEESGTATAKAAVFRPNQG